MMDSLHLVDPTLRPLLEMLPPISLTADILPAMRNRPSMLPPPDESLATLEIHTVPGPAGAPDIDLHGGGYVMGKVSDYDPLVRPLIADLHCVMVSVEYRLAPETNFPGPIEDCYAGLAWTIANANRLGIDPTRLGVMGQSAGGGYAAALALMVRDRGEYALAFQHRIRTPASLCGLRRATASAGPRCLATRPVATTSRPTRHQPAPPISATCRGPISRPVRLISSSTRTSTTRHG
jgi:hypothetical protein